MAMHQVQQYHDVWIPHLQEDKNYGRLLLARNIHPAHSSRLHAMKDDGTILWTGSQRDLVGSLGWLYSSSTILN